MESRWSGILSNDMETIPMGLLIAWNSCLFGLSNPYHVALLTLFAASRLGHTYAYAMGMQPHRTMAYILGSIAVVGLGLNALWGLW